VTPSFNQGQYLEESIRSILLQGYPDLEYFVIDGGSTDQSVEIIRKYEPWLTYWVSEPDGGQANAINKGLARATGEIFNWINSDDYLLPRALERIVGNFGDMDAVAGVVINFDDCCNQYPFFQNELEVEKLVFGNVNAVYHQPGLWLVRDKVAACGGIDESYQYSFEWDITLRYLSLYPRVTYLPDVLVHFRLHPGSKTCAGHEHQIDEKHRVFEKLRVTAAQPALRAACDLQLRRVHWTSRLGEFLRSNNGSRFSRIQWLAIESCRDPVVRWTRPTLGALRRVLLSSNCTDAAETSD
jgi:glycosyltransferase involved in cell wall biosynthesis